MSFAHIKERREREREREQLACIYSCYFLGCLPMNFPTYIYTYKTNSYQSRFHSSLKMQNRLLVHVIGAP